MPTLSVVIVAHNSRQPLEATLPALAGELRGGDELIVVDNASADDSAAVARKLAPGAEVIETGSNGGFAAGCNRGAEAATGELICLLNPDAIPQPGWRDAIERPATDGSGWDAWQALVTSDDGTKINTRGGIVHFTGIAWAGGAGEPASGTFTVPETANVGFVSGACLVIARERYLELGGMPEEFFLYHEDVDLSLRVRLAGGRLGVADDARVDHGYEFDKGAAKWRYLERNRWATLIRDYPASLLALIMPALIATELALLVASAAGGWLPQKLRAYGEVLLSLPRLFTERRRIQAARTISAGEFAAGLVSSLGSAYLGAAGRSRLLAAILGAYWRVVLVCLGARRA
jgi:N-acetylglucosaminyl-diphospho-decaprenol L-rhamnosyltransferase